MQAKGKAVAKTKKALVAQKALLGACVGTLIEYYDYVLFSIFLPIFSPVFFPAATVYDSLVKGYFIFLITMIFRPLGGLLFGYIGDAIGRPKALLASMYGIAISTVMIGITPSYAAIGMWAGILVGFAKGIQIFCFGGEYNGAGIYVVEHSPPHKAALTSSLLAATTGGGALLAALVGVIITQEGMPEWSWRLAFIIGGIVGIFGVYYRKNLAESPEFIPADTHKDNFSSLIKNYPRELIAGFFIGGVSTAPITTELLFINPVLMSKGIINSHQMMMLQSYFSIIGIIFLLIAGKIASRYTAAKIMRFSSLALAFLSYPLLKLVDFYHIPLIIFIVTLLLIINEFFFGPANAYLKDLFPMQFRYRGSSFSFCLGLSVIGGATPLVESYLYKLTGSFGTAGLWLVLVGLGAYWSLTNICYNKSLPKHSNKSIWPGSTY